MKHMKPMKKMKRLLGVLLAAVMVLAFGMTASAQKVTNSSQHDYKAYKIFTGTEEADNKMVITGWGDGVDSVALLNELKTIDSGVLSGEFSTCNDALTVADVVAGFSEDSPEARAFAVVVSKHLSSTSTPIAGSTSSVELQPGYYLFVDTSVQGGDEENYVRGLSILQVTNNGDINLQPKNDAPTVSKKVKEDDITTDGGFGQGYNDVADYSEGENVPFKLIGTLPTAYNTYTTYKYVFHDTLSSGLTFNQGTVNVYAFINGNIADTTENNKVNVTTYFQPQVENQNMTITCLDLKQISQITSTSKIVVEYTAKLNENAEIGLPGNTNEVYLEYSNNPNFNGAGDTGKTPIDKVIVFTYELDINKVDLVGGTKPLSGAEFKLQNAQGEWVIVVNNKVTGWTANKEDGSILTTDQAGKCVITGLDDGTYTLVETKAPEDYKLPENPNTTIVIDATTSNIQDWNGQDAGDVLTALKITVGLNETQDGNVNEGKVTAQIVNSKLSSLPETGGIGTTLFYVIGGILVIGAAVLLITRRRMNKQD